jgi:site-specific recombinase XerD
MNNLKYNLYINKFNEFLEIRDLTANTAKNYKSFLKQFLTWVDSNLNKPLNEVSYDEIRIYILHLRNVRKLSPPSINAHISQLRFFYIYILNKPFDKYQVPFMKTTRKLPAIVSKKDIFFYRFF